MKTKISKIMKKGRVFILAYDQGLEHGPSDFTDENVNPENIIKLANTLGFTGLAVQKGIAEKYRKQIKVPLIIKLNGKTNLVKGEPISEQLCSIKEALALKASAVGYTIYLGSEHEAEMMKEFSKIEEEAHAHGLPLILWAYPRGESIEGRNKEEVMAYSARVALELGADFVKLQYTGNKEALKWAVKTAGKTKVIVAGGLKVEDSKIFDLVREEMSCGIVGIAIGRNVWQNAKPLDIGKKLKKAVLG